MVFELNQKCTITKSYIKFWFNMSKHVGRKYGNLLLQKLMEIDV